MIDAVMEVAMSGIGWGLVSATAVAFVSGFANLVLRTLAESQRRQREADSHPHGTPAEQG
jgi:hypothetical protein